MNLLPRLQKGFARAFFGPRIRTQYSGELIRLGSKYGGWVLAPTAALQGGLVVSCGLGEDASFDVEVATHFDARVLVVDPTPRAVRHFEALALRVGQAREVLYSSGGRQPVTAYDLTGVSRDQLVLVPKAVTESGGIVRFYAPPNPADVSHSVVNFQNGYSLDSPFIEVESVDFPTLLSECAGEMPALVKFDIEGAEITVIPHLIAAGIRPEQVLVEYDELNWPSKVSRRKFEAVHDLLLASGYFPIHFDRRTCVSYLFGGRT
jgi:FkbM family methyltransferase